MTRFQSVQTVEEALDVLAEVGDGARPLAGGTDVMIQMHRLELAPGLLLHIEPVEQLRAISADNLLRLGALASHDRIARSAEVRRMARSLSEAAATVGGWQTQAVGTIGGNVVNASPAADLLPPLLVNDATIVLRSRSHEREIAVADFVVDRRSTTRQPDELVTEFRIAAAPDRTADAYYKVGRRGAMEVAIVGLAVRLSLSADLHTIDDARVAVCSCGPVPFRATECENLLVGQALTPELVADAGHSLVRRARPIDDARASAAYRQQLLPRVLAEAVRRAAAAVHAGKKGTE